VEVEVEVVTPVVAAVLVVAARGGGRVGGFGGAGFAAVHGSTMGPMMMHAGPGPGTMMMHAGPMGPMMRGRGMTGGRVQAWGWHDHMHDHFHHRFHNRFFAFGFGGPYYDYAYNFLLDSGSDRLWLAVG
jgi:hypothetical protein